MTTARELLAEKYLKDPDFIPPDGKSKEEAAGEIVDQKLRQNRNNVRAFELLVKDQEEAKYTWHRDKDAVQEPTERDSKRFVVKEMPEKYKEVSLKHLQIIHRPLEVIEGTVEDFKVDAPPAPGSKELKDELGHMTKAKQFLEVNPELEQDIKQEDKNLLKPFLDYAQQNNLKVDEDYLDKLAEDIVSIVMFWKYKYNQPRPFQFDGHDERDNVSADTPSYPSGHSTQAKVIAEVLGRSYPKHAKDFESIGEQVGVNRVVAGWHYPIDHSTGKDLADQIIDKLPENVEMFLKKASFAEDDYLGAIKSAMSKHADDFNIPSGLDIQKKEGEFTVDEGGRRAQETESISKDDHKKMLTEFFLSDYKLRMGKGEPPSKELMDKVEDELTKRATGGSYLDVVNSLAKVRYSNINDIYDLDENQLAEVDKILGGVKFTGTGSKLLNNHLKQVRGFTDPDAGDAGEDTTRRSGTPQQSEADSGGQTDAEQREAERAAASTEAPRATPPSNSDDSSAPDNQAQNQTDNSTPETEPDSDDDYTYDYDISRFPLTNEIGEPVHINRAALDISNKSRPEKDGGLGFFTTPGVAITALQRLGLSGSSPKEQVDAVIDKLKAYKESKGDEWKPRTGSGANKFDLDEFDKWSPSTPTPEAPENVEEPEDDGLNLSDVVSYDGLQDKDGKDIPMVSAMVEGKRQAFYRDSDKGWLPFSGIKQGIKHDKDGVARFARSKFQAARKASNKDLTPFHFEDIPDKKQSGAVKDVIGKLDDAVEDKDVQSVDVANVNEILNTSATAATQARNDLVENLLGQGEEYSANHINHIIWGKELPNSASQKLRDALNAAQSELGQSGAEIGEPQPQPQQQERGPSTSDTDASETQDSSEQRQEQPQSDATEGTLPPDNGEQGRLFNGDAEEATEDTDGGTTEEGADDIGDSSDDGDRGEDSGSPASTDPLRKDWEEYFDDHPEAVERHLAELHTTATGKLPPTSPLLQYAGDDRKPTRDALLDYIVASARDKNTKVTEAFVKSINKHHNDHINDAAKDQDSANVESATTEENQRKRQAFDEQFKLRPQMGGRAYRAREQANRILDYLVEQEQSERSPRFTNIDEAKAWYQNAAEEGSYDWEKDFNAAHKAVNKLAAEEQAGQEAQGAEEQKNAYLDDFAKLKNIKTSDSQHTIEDKLIAAMHVGRDHKEYLDSDPKQRRAYEDRVARLADFAGGLENGQKAVANLQMEQKAKGAKFLDTDHMNERGEGREKAERAHESHEKHLNEVNNQKFEHSSFKHEDHDEGQKFQDVSSKDYKKDYKSGQKAGKTDAEIAADRVRRGLPPGPAPRPGLQWHKETHRWINPNTYNDLGKVLNFGESAHIADPQEMGLAGHIDTTPGGGMVAYKGKDGKVHLYSAGEAVKNKHGLGSLDPTNAAHRPSHAAHARAIAAGHLANSGKVTYTQQQLLDRMKVNDLVSNLEQFQGRRRAGALKTAGKQIGAGALIGMAIPAIAGVGALGSGGLLGIGAALAAPAAYKGLKRFKQYSRQNIARNIKEEVPSLSDTEQRALNRFSDPSGSARSRLLGNTAKVAGRAAAIAAFPPLALTGGDVGSAVQKLSALVSGGKSRSGG